MKKWALALAVALATFVLVACDTAAIGDSVNNFNAGCSAIADCTEKIKALDEEMVFVEMESIVGDITLRQARDKIRSMEAERDRLVEHIAELEKQEQDRRMELERQRARDQSAAWACEASMLPTPTTSVDATGIILPTIGQPDSALMAQIEEECYKDYRAKWAGR